MEDFDDGKTYEANPLLAVMISFQCSVFSEEFLAAENAENAEEEFLGMGMWRKWLVPGDQ